MSLQGNFSDLPMVDLMQVLTLQNKTGILSISWEFSQAQVCFSSSRLYSAYVRRAEPGRSYPLSLDGEAAIYDLLAWPNGQFTFELSPALPTHQNIHAGWHSLVLEYYRLLDAQQHDWQLAEVGAKRPRLVFDPPAHAQVAIGLEEWQILLQVTGQATLKEIAERTRQDLASIDKIATRLLELGLIELETSLQAASIEYQLPGGYAPVKSYQPGGNQSQVVHYRREETVTPSRGQTAVLSPTATAPVTAVASQPHNLAPAQKPKVQRGLLSSIMAKIRGL